MSTSTRLRHSGTALAHSLSASAWRDAFTVRPADAIVTTPLKVGIAATLVLIAGGLLGEPQLAGMAALGALTSAFGRYQPYRRLGRMMAIVGVGMVAAIVAGALMGAGAVSMEVQVLVLSALAAVAAHVFRAFRITGPGAVILVFAAGAGAGYTQSPADIMGPVTAVAIGVVVGWIAAMAPMLWSPLAPSRLAVARAMAAVLRLRTDDGDTHRAAARTALRLARDSVAVSAGPLRAGSSRSLGIHRSAERLNLLLDEAESALTLFETSTNSSFSLAFARLTLRESELRKLQGIPTASAAMVTARTVSRQHPAPDGFWAGAREQLGSRSSINQALRMAVAAALSGWVAAALGLDHPLWATMGAVAALQGMNYAATVQRSIQRLVGNVVGSAIAVLILSLSLGFWPSVALVVAFQMVAELLVLKNYTLTTIAVTPMALIMTGLGTGLGPDAALSRVMDTLVGVAFGTVVAALSISLADRHHLSEDTQKS